MAEGLTDAIGDALARQTALTVTSSDTVGADFLWDFVEDRHSRLHARLDEERLLAGDLPQGLPQREPERRHDARDDDLSRRLRPSGRLEKSADGQDDLVGRFVPPRRQPPVAQQLPVLEETEHRVRIADVHREERRPGPSHHSDTSP